MKLQIREHRKGGSFTVVAGEDEFEAGTVDVFDDVLFPDKSKGWKINWSSVGSVDIERAKMFRDALDKAIRIAESKGEL